MQKFEAIEEGEESSSYFSSDSIRLLSPFQENAVTSDLCRGKRILVRNCAFFDTDSYLSKICTI